VTPPLVCLDAWMLGVLVGVGCLVILMVLGVRWGFEVRERMTQVEMRLARLQRERHLEDARARTRPLPSTDPPTPP